MIYVQSRCRDRKAQDTAAEKLGKTSKLKRAVERWAATDSVSETAIYVILDGRPPVI